MDRRMAATLLLAALLALSACAPLPAEAPSPTPAPSAAPAPTPTPAAPASTNGGVPAPVATPVPASELDGVADPDDVLPQHASYSEAKAINEEVIGWLTVPNTQIDYPVARTENNEFYLNHDIEKEESSYGAVFMDFRNANAAQQRHIILYGHNMKNGTMFHDLHNYKQRSFFEQNRIITFLWDGLETRWEIYAAYVVENAKDTYYIHTRFNSDENYAEYMNSLIDYAKNSKYGVVDEDVTIRGGDQVLTLSTCTYEYDHSFYVVSARRIQ